MQRPLHEYKVYSHDHLTRAFACSLHNEGEKIKLRKEPVAIHNLKQYERHISNNVSDKRMKHQLNIFAYN